MIKSQKKNIVIVSFIETMTDNSTIGLFENDLSFHFFEVDNVKTSLQNAGGMGGSR